MKTLPVVIILMNSFRILILNDVHGSFYSSSSRVKFERVKALISSLGPEVTVLHAGRALPLPEVEKFPQTFLSALQMFEALSRLQVQVVSVSSFETAWDPQFIKEQARARRLKFVSLNIVDSAGEPLFDRYEVLKKGREKLLVTGVTFSNRNPHRSGVVLMNPKASASLLKWLMQKENAAACIVFIDGSWNQIEQFARALKASVPVFLVSSSIKGFDYAPFKVSKNVFIIRPPGKWRFPYLLEVSKSHPRGKIIDVFTLAPERGAGAFLSHEPSMPELVTRPVKGYAGWKTCSKCHSQEAQRWLETPHASAWKKIETLGRESDPYCVKCHLTGWMWDGKVPSAEYVNDMGAVQCEACHGPAETHSRGEKPLPALPDISWCQRCHLPSYSAALTSVKCH